MDVHAIIVDAQDASVNGMHATLSPRNLKGIKPTPVPSEVDNIYATVGLEVA